jgi:hypothetical protein
MIVFVGQNGQNKSPLAWLRERHSALRRVALTCPLLLRSVRAPADAGAVLNALLCRTHGALRRPDLRARPRRALTTLRSWLCTKLRRCNFRALRS